MSYPGSVTTFATKVDAVDYVLADHVNDLQTEVSAVEAGLLNGFEHHLKANGATRDLGTSGAPFRDLHLSGDAAIPGTVTAGDVVADTITFPATQVPNAGANVLDDYQEGSWTPVLGGVGGTTGQTYNIQIGRYIKIGRKVTAIGRILFTTKGTITSSLQIQGLPFTSVTLANFFPGTLVAAFWESPITLILALTGRVESNSTVASLFITDGINAVPFTPTTADIDTTFGLSFTVEYFAAD